MTPTEFRQHRDTLGLTQAALAAVLHVSVGHISHIEQGTARPSDALAAHLRLVVAGAGLAPASLPSVF